MKWKKLVYGIFSDRIFFSGNNNGMEIMMMEFYFQKLEKGMPKCRLNRGKNTSPPLREAEISPSFLVGFFLRTETRWLSNKNHPKHVSNVRVFWGIFFSYSRPNIMKFYSTLFCSSSSSFGIESDSFSPVLPRKGFHSSPFWGPT